MRKTRKYRIFFGKRLVQNFEHRTDYRKHMKFEQEMGSKNLLPFFFESATLYCNQTKRKRKNKNVGKEVCDEEKERREYTPKKKERISVSI